MKILLSSTRSKRHYYLSLFPLGSLNFITVIQLWLEMLLDDSEFPPSSLLWQKTNRKWVDQMQIKVNPLVSGNSGKKEYLLRSSTFCLALHFKARCSFSKLWDNDNVSFFQKSFYLALQTWKWIEQKLVERIKILSRCDNSEWCLWTKMEYGLLDLLS